MKKQIGFFLLLALFGNTHAVLLKDGSNIPQEKVDEVMTKLKLFLTKAPTQHQISNENLELTKAKLYDACAHKIHYPGDKFYQDTSNIIWGSIDELNAYGLCDKKGYITDDTAHVVYSAFDLMFWEKVRRFFGIYPFIFFVLGADPNYRVKERSPVVPII